MGMFEKYTKGLAKKGKKKKKHVPPSVKEVKEAMVESIYDHTESDFAIAHGEKKPNPIYTKMIESREKKKADAAKKKKAAAAKKKKVAAAKKKKVAAKKKKATKTTIDTESYQVKRKPSQIRKKKAHVHNVSSGETLSAIARRYGTTVAKLKAENKIKDIHKIRVGQKIRVPKINVARDVYKGTSKKALTAHADRKAAERRLKESTTTMGTSEPPAPSPQPKKFDPEYMSDEDMRYLDEDMGAQSGGMIGQSDMTAKKVTAPRAKRKVPQYYKGGGKVKKNYAYGGRVAKYKG